MRSAQHITIFSTAQAWGGQVGAGRWRDDHHWQCHGHVVSSYQVRSELMDDVQGWGLGMDTMPVALWVKWRWGWGWARWSKALSCHEVCMGANGLAQVQGSSDGGVIGIVNVNVGVERVWEKVKGCHMVVHQTVLDWDYEAKCGISMWR